MCFSTDALTEEEALGNFELLLAYLHGKVFVSEHLSVANIRQWTLCHSHV